MARSRDRKGTAASETSIQIAIAQGLELQRVHAIWFHVPNGGKRQKTEAAIMKAMGTKAGIPDLVFLWGGGCGGIEIKKPRSGQRESQKEVQADFERHGIPYEIARNLDEVLVILQGWGILADHRKPFKFQPAIQPLLPYAGTDPFVDRALYLIREEGHLLTPVRIAEVLGSAMVGMAERDKRATGQLMEFMEKGPRPIHVRCTSLDPRCPLRTLKEAK